MHLVRGGHEFDEGDLDSSDQIIRRQLVAVPELHGERFLGANLVVTDDEVSGLLPNWRHVTRQLRTTAEKAGIPQLTGVEIVRDDPGGKQGLPKLAVSQDDVLAKHLLSVGGRMI